MFEFDVRQTGDGTLVVHHDPDIDGVPLSAMTVGAAVARAERLATGCLSLPTSCDGRAAGCVWTSS